MIAIDTPELKIVAIMSEILFAGFQLVMSGPIKPPASHAIA